jgi:hypothetical protein
MPLPACIEALAEHAGEMCSLLTASMLLEDRDTPAA